MRRPSIRSRIFLAMTLVVTGFVVLGTFTMNRLLEGFLDREIGQGLARARAAHERFAGIRDELLADKVRSVAQVPHLRATLGTPDVDAETVAFTVQTVAAVAGSPLVLLGDGSGDLLAEAGRPDAPPASLLERPGVSDVLAGREFSGIWSHGGAPHRVTVAPVVLGEQVLGFLCLGQPLDDAEAADLARVTGHDVFLYGGGRLLGRAKASAEAGDAAPPAEVPASVLETVERRSPTRAYLDGVEHLMSAVPLAGGVTLVLARPIDELLQEFRQAGRTLLATGVVLALLGLAVSARISSGIGRPIREVVRASKELASGDLKASARIVARDDELGLLGRSFNEMARRIEALVEEVLEKAQAEEQGSRAKSDFLATMSHELRTPMNAVLGFAELLSRSAIQEPEREHAAAIQRAGRELMRLLDGMLDLAGADAGRLELEEAAFDLRTVVGQAAEPARADALAKGVAFDTTVDEALPRRVVGDPGRFRQVVSHLVGNAVKFTSSGRVELRVELRAEARDGLADGTTVKVTVADTGIGIDPARLERLFEPFSQLDSASSRRFGGSGLGLAICKRLAGRMGGECGVESDPGRGSTFWFTARLRPVPEVAGADEPAPPAPAPRAGAEPRAPLATAREAQGPSGEERRADQRILYVEDNPVNRRMVALFLRKAGWSADFAENGEEALRKLDAGESFDLVLMDCQMPVMDGYEATRRIREREGDEGRRLPIVALTANAMEGDRERCFAAGMDDFIAKPASYATIVGVLDGWLAPVRSITADPSLGGRREWA